jgi:hypothetical protein
VKQIETCKICKRRAFDPKKGTICSLTNAKPTFESECPEFVKDEKQIKKENTLLKDYLPNDKWTKRLLITFGIVIALHLLQAISNYMQYNLLQSILEGTSSGMGIENNDIRQFIIGLLDILAFISSAIFFTIWFYRSYHNVHLRIDYCQFDKSYAILGWFIPIANFYIPYQIMKEIYLETKAQLVLTSGEYSKTNLTGLIGWWWATWLIALPSNYCMKQLNTWKGISGVINFTIADLITGILFGISAILTFKLIKEFSQLDEKLRTIELEKVLS